LVPGELQAERGAGKGKKVSSTKKAERLALFVAEYLIDMNATRAAIRCGYAANSAAVTASRLMKDPWVKAELRRALQERKKRLKLTAERFDEEVAKLAYSNVLDYWDRATGGINLAAVDRDQAAAISELKVNTIELPAHGPADQFGNGPVLISRTVKFKTHSKPQALMLMGRRLKLLKEEVELKGKVTLVVDM
jgi:phage terminase small subunit